MANVVVAQRMWQRRGSAALWTSRNPVMAAGEIGVELGATPTDPQKFKIGNGVTAWNDLDYAGGGGSGGGSVWRDGTGAPSDSLGADGDYYLDTATGDVYKRISGAYTPVGNIKGEPGDPGDPGPPGSSESAIVFGGGDRVNFIAPGEKALQPVDFAATILRWRLITDNPAGNISIDLRKAPFASYPPTSGDSIVAAAPPALAASDHGTSVTLTGWDTAINPGDVIVPVVTSVGGVRWWNLTLHIQKV
jgi:hypothetical protein